MRAYDGVVHDKDGRAVPYQPQPVLVTPMDYSGLLVWPAQRLLKNRPTLQRLFHSKKIQKEREQKQYDRDADNTVYKRWKSRPIGSRREFARKECISYAEFLKLINRVQRRISRDAGGS